MPATAHRDVLWLFPGRPERDGGPREMRRVPQLRGATPEKSPASQLRVSQQKKSPAKVRQEVALGDGANAPASLPDRSQAHVTGSLLSRDAPAI
jgi:hypothetical protein